jgi:hypothetical protein
MADEGGSMDWKKLFSEMTDRERKAAAEALGTTEPVGNGAQASAAKDEELWKIRAEQRTGRVDAYVKAQLEANKIVPAEEAALREEYLQALLDDEAYPVLEGRSRIARIEARQHSRPTHNPIAQARAQAEKYAAERNQATRRAYFLSEETMKTDLQKGAAVPPSSDDPLARAQAQAEKYAAQRNRG